MIEKKKSSRGKTKGKAKAKAKLHIAGCTVFPFDALLRPELELKGDFGFFNAKAKWCEATRATIACKEVACLSVPSGRIIALDPFVGSDERPFRQKVPPGEYPVYLSRLLVKGAKEPVNAAAILKIERGPVSEWKPALKVGGSSHFAVDSATACFIDAGALKPLFAMQDPQNPMPAYEQVWNSHDGSLILVPKTGANIVSFNTGYGDGIYRSWLGYQGDKLLSIVIDFQILQTLEAISAVSAKDLSRQLFPSLYES